MDYNTTGSSNSATNGSKLELKIKISPDLPTNPIFLMGLTINNLDTIAAKGKDLKQLTCTLYGKTDDKNLNKTNPVLIYELSYRDASPGTRFYYNKNSNKGYSYLILEIKTDICTIGEHGANLSISFKHKNKVDGKQLEYSFSFAVESMKAKPEILEFKADRTVLQGNNKPLKLSWQIKGTNFTYTLFDGLEKLDSGNGTGTKNGLTKINSVPIGDHCYTLVVEQGGATVTLDKMVRALNDSELSNKGNPGLPNVICNFCVSNNSDYLFSLVLKKEDTTASLDHIGFTNEGFSGHWSRFELTAEVKEKLQPFATSPMVHLRDVSEVDGRLLFIGGSYVRPMEDSNKVAIVYLDGDLGLDGKTVTLSRITIVAHPDIPWSSRMGHCCVTFPHGYIGEEKIWLLGGYDEDGNTLNDIWVSGDGKTWNNINADGSVNNTANAAEMPWGARCTAGASVQLNDDGTKKALWIGGGFSAMGGAETADIWKWEKGPDKIPPSHSGGGETFDKWNWEWKQIYGDKARNELLKINEGSYFSSGLAFVGKDTINSTGMFVLGGHEVVKFKKERYFDKIDDNGNESFGFIKLDTSSGAGSFGTSKNSYVVTGYFKGCLWFMVFTNEGSEGVTYSNLFYWVPVVTSRTLILV
jgi:hypothetical protein